MALFYAEVRNEDRVSSGGGVAAEGEMIEVVELKVSEIKEYLRQPDVNSPTFTLYGLQWFLLNKLDGEIWTYFDDFIRASSGQGTLINIKTTMHLLYLSIYKLASYLVAQSTTYLLNQLIKDIIVLQIVSYAISSVAFRTFQYSMYTQSWWKGTVW